MEVLRNLPGEKLLASIPMRLWFAPAYRNKNDPRDLHYHEFEDWQFDMLLEKAGWKIIHRHKWTHPTNKIVIRPLLRKLHQDIMPFTQNESKISNLNKYSIVIPAHNEEEFIKITLDSLVNQTITPYQVVIVNDNSTDNTQIIIEEYANKYEWITLFNRISKGEHQPGSKVIQAFLAGYEIIKKDYDFIVKLDADLDIPTNYFETILKHFNANPKYGMVGGFAYIEKNGDWILENLTDKDHIRGAFKAYRKETYNQIEGLRPHMGWDTVDELLCHFYNWDIKTDDSLHIKHLKPTGAVYSKSALYKQGTAYYALGYGFWITLIAATKLALRKKKLSYIRYYIQGYLQAWRKKQPKMVTAEQEKFIRNYRWSKMKQKVLK
ncbi:glycosyltransferase [Faecalibacter macacae]|nr:glycosyltransferase family 2 protein [Faecalibacter macacae]